MDDLPCYNENACINDKWGDDDNEFEQEEEESREVDDSPPSYNEENVHQEISSRKYDVGVELSECLTGTRVGWPTNSPESMNSPQSPPYREEDQGPSFCTNNSPAAKMAFSFAGSELKGESDEPLDNRTATALVADEDQALMKSPVIRSREVEIIDLLTPSPCYAAIHSGRTKKRRPTLCPEIIDLTNSPLYV